MSLEPGMAQVLIDQPGVARHRRAPRQIATALVQKQRLEKLITIGAARAQHARQPRATPRPAAADTALRRRSSPHRCCVLSSGRRWSLVQILDEPPAETLVRGKLGLVHAVADDFCIFDLRWQTADPTAHQIEQHAAFRQHAGDRNRSARRPHALVDTIDEPRRLVETANCLPRRCGGRRRPAIRGTPSHSVPLPFRVPRWICPKTRSHCGAACRSGLDPGTDPRQDENNNDGWALHGVRLLSAANLQRATRCICSYILSTPGLLGIPYPGISNRRSKRHRQ